MQPRSLVSSKQASLSIVRQVVNRRGTLRAGFAGGLSLLLPGVHACEFWSTNLRIVLPWSRATIEGDAFAIGCMRFDEVEQDDRLIGAESPVARNVEMGGVGASHQLNFAIPAGRQTELSEAGTYLKLVGLRHPLGLGREYPLKLVFERGGMVDADIDVQYARQA